MAYAQSNLQGLYLQKEASWGVIPNSSGTATLAGSNACRAITATLKGQRGRIDRPDKTPTLGRTVGTPGRRTTSGAISMSMAGNGAAGVAPDCNPLLISAFGADPVITPSTKVNYGLSSAAIPSLTAWSFRKPSTVTQQALFGAVVQTMRVSIGQDVATLDFDLEGKWCIDNDQFATAETEAKGGLTTFPSEPGSPVTNGNMVIGYKGAVSIDGNSYDTVRPATITLALDRELPADGFNTDYKLSPGAGIRTVTVDLSLYDDDSANLKTLKGKAFDQVPIDIVFTVGTVAGNRWKWTLKNVLLPAGDYDDSQRRYVFNISGAQAHQSNGSTEDELALEIY